MVVKVARLTEMPNGFHTYMVDNLSIAKDIGNVYTVIINTDSGKTFTTIKNGFQFTLPSIAIGNVFTFVNMNPDGVGNILIASAGGETITYAGSVAGDPLENLKATAKRGDFVTLSSQSSTTNWQVVNARGVWKIIGS